jgi:hypothetical protein
MGMTLLACASASTSLGPSVDSRERRVEETFACSGLNDLLLYTSTEDMQADPSSTSGFALSGKPLEVESPAIVGATVGTSQRLLVGSDPKAELNYIRFFLAPQAASRIAEVTRAAEESRSGLTVHVVRQGEPLYTASVFTAIVDGTAELHVNHLNPQAPDEFIPAQQRALCP